MPRTLGILLDSGVWRGIPSGRTAHEKISFYNRAAAAHKVRVIFFPLTQLNLKANRVKAYMRRNRSFKLMYSTIPAVIHNRSMPSHPSLRRKLKLLAKRRKVYNEQTRYSKYSIHRVLDKKDRLGDYLPETKSFTQSNLLKMMDRFESLYIKPVSSSIGRGIFRISKQGKKHWMIQGEGKKSAKKTEKVFTYLKQKLKKKSYLIQEAIPLAQYKGKPFDIRVSVQRSGDGDWQVTGMIGKVARKGSHVTNVARGGKIVRCEKLFKSCGLPVQATIQEVERVSLELANYLGKKLRNLADIGFDIGIDGEGRPYFIEMNGRDLRYSFGKGKLMEKWYKTYENPIKYGKYLMKNS
ncbi:YheC/YheD family protein [Ammoniphilus sp. YIM 78166]|uniref:YheC/YheD family endospore coat-associated protein n=1 Tax=Ammoniphilus sp. YIM 78166 TaxID=1644106 RepID=UPI00106F77B1|nr:YheC/YheD family protein [Ammoniphilus sp. YIM 78166]